MDKKPLIVVITSLFLLASLNSITNAGEQNNNNVLKSYLFESPVISRINIDSYEYDSICMNNLPCDANPGEPLLPMKGVYLLLPPNSKVSSIVINPGERIFLGAGYLVEPAGEVFSLSDTQDAPIPIPNEKIYSSTEMFPGKLYTEVGTYHCKGYVILILILHPVQYIPAKGELYYYPDLTVNVETTNVLMDNSLYRGLRQDNNEVMAKVDNPDMLGAYSQTLHRVTYQMDYDLLIITSDALKSGFEPLKQAHDSEGIETLIYTVEDIYNNFTGIDEPDKIRNFIKYAYETYGIEYVLLGGDTEIVPARYLFGSNILGNLPSDLYYAGLDGTWNSPETPNPSDMDISVGDPGIEVTCSDDLIGPSVDYTNYIIGNSSMRFNCTNEIEHAGIDLIFNNPIDLSNENYFRFSFNLSRSDLLLNTSIGFLSFFLSKMGIVLFDSKGFVRIFMTSFYSHLGGSWESVTFYIKEKSLRGRLFNFHEVVRVGIIPYLNTSITVTENDFIRLDGIYFSDNISDLYGEKDEESDLFAEVFVGRACVDNLNDVQNFTSKTISYMNTDNDQPYLKKVLLVGEDLGAMLHGKWGGNYMDDLVGKCHRYFYTTQGFPENKFDIDKLYDRNWRLNGWPEPDIGTGGWPKQDIIDRINSDVHIIDHIGHGNNYHNMKLDEPVTMRSGIILEECHDVYNMTNDKYFFVYSQACFSGAFDNIGENDKCLPYDSIAEYLTVKTEHGAFAGIWNSRYGVGKGFSTNGPSQCYNRQFWDAVFDENITVISKANQDSKEDNAWRINLVFGIYRGLYYELNYFGDPSISFKYLDSSLVSSQSTSQSNPQSKPSVQPSSPTITQLSSLILKTKTSSSTLSTK
ncbi:MAG TPA: C25 family cysteine peptidase [Candidatus Thermoplasmatota archaeon]|nr:C25 family cysteine peptidase [Candidatus Thermoplasmatota archaeon]